MFRVRSSLCIVPSPFLFIRLLNAGLEFDAEFVDFHAGPMSLFVTTLFVYVVTLQLHMCLQALLLVCRNISAMSSMFAFCHVCHNKVYEHRNINAISYVLIIVVSLSQYSCLIFLLSYCRNKVFHVTTNFLALQCYS